LKVLDLRIFEGFRYGVWKYENKANIMMAANNRLNPVILGKN